MSKTTVRDVKVHRIRSNSWENSKYVYIELSKVHPDKAEKGWARVIPDNEGARWIVNLAMEAKIHKLSCYAYGNLEDGRLTLYEFGLE